MSRKVLDACCGPRGMWCCKTDSRIIGLDKRCVSFEGDPSADKSLLAISPDIVGDFRDMPFDDNRFSLVVFDPPHLKWAGKSGRFLLRYGELDRTSWEEDMAAGFRECLRVLRPGGILLFKWSTAQIPLERVRKLYPCSPLFDSRQGKTHHIIFMKGESEA